MNNENNILKKIKNIFIKYMDKDFEEYIKNDEVFFLGKNYLSKKSVFSSQNILLDKALNDDMDYHIVYNFLLKYQDSVVYLFTRSIKDQDSLLSKEVKSNSIISVSFENEKDKMNELILEFQMHKNIENKSKLKPIMIYISYFGDIPLMKYIKDKVFFNENAKIKEEIVEIINDGINEKIYFVIHPSSFFDDTIIHKLNISKVKIHKKDQISGKLCFLTFEERLKMLKEIKKTKLNVYEYNDTFLTSEKFDIKNMWNKYYLEKKNEQNCLISKDTSKLILEMIND